MPELCRFYGIVIRLYFADHAPPHFHAFYGNHEVVINIENFSVVRGSLPPRALGLVVEWAQLRKEAISSAWLKAVALESPGKIEPLP